jgi:hypothetical protein
MTVENPTSIREEQEILPPFEYNNQDQSLIVGRLFFDLSPLFMLMTVNIDEQLIPIICRIVAQNNPDYIQFLLDICSDYVTSYTFEYSLNPEYLYDMFDLSMLTENEKQEHIRRHHENVFRVFARDENGNRILGNDGNYVMGIMEEFPELFQLLRESLNPIHHIHFETDLYPYLPVNN